MVEGGWTAESSVGEVEGDTGSSARGPEVR